jgi:hypothetical protein
MPLSDKEYAVGITRAMGMKVTTQALDYIKDVYKIPLTANEYYRVLGTIESKAIEQMQEIALKMPIIHMERLNEFIALKDGCYQDLHREENPYRRVMIRMKIAELHQYISQLQTMSKRVLEKYVTKEMESREISL